MNAVKQTLVYPIGTAREVRYTNVLVNRFQKRPTRRMSGAVGAISIHVTALGGITIIGSNPPAIINSKNNS